MPFDERGPSSWPALTAVPTADDANERPGDPRL